MRPHLLTLARYALLPISVGACLFVFGFILADGALRRLSLT